LGASPQTPRVGFAEFWVKESLARFIEMIFDLSIFGAELTLLLLFWKRRASDE
jgi:hypothetical protein